MQTSTIFFLFFNDTATTEIYTLSLHDALPIFEHIGTTGALEWIDRERPHLSTWFYAVRSFNHRGNRSSLSDRKSTRLNSSHANISYAVFCLKHKKTRRLSDFERADGQIA